MQKIYFLLSIPSILESGTDGKDQSETVVRVCRNDVARGKDSNGPGNSGLGGSFIA
jgi:hypothetical protein